VKPYKLQEVMGDNSDSPIIPPWTKTDANESNSECSEGSSSECDSSQGGEFEEVVADCGAPAGYSARSFSDLDPSKDIQEDSFIVESFNKAISKEE